MEENEIDLDIILQDCLAKIRSGQETLDSALAYYPHIAADLRQLLEAALWIQSRQEAFQPRAGFVSSSRHRVVEQIQQEKLVIPAGRHLSWWEKILQSLSVIVRPKRQVALLAVSILLVLALLLTAGGTGIAKASKSALPGDLLYSVKRTIEKAELALTPGEAGKAEIYIQNTQSRLDEIQSLLERNQSEYLSQTISLFEDQAYNAIGYMVVVGEKDNGRARELAGKLNSTLQSKSDVLRHLAAAAPYGVNNEINRLLSVSDEMIVLIGDRVLLVSATATVTPTATATPGIAVVVPPRVTPIAPIAPTIPPSPGVIVPTPPGSNPALSITPTITSTLSIDAGDKKPTHTPKKTHKPTKTPKVKKTKRPLPDPTRRPPRPDN